MKSEWLANLSYTRSAVRNVPARLRRDSLVVKLVQVLKCYNHIASATLRCHYVVRYCDVIAGGTSNDGRWYVVQVTPLVDGLDDQKLEMASE